MASPESLCAVFGRRLPKDVADIIFEYGFHLWLSRPHDVAVQLDMDYGTHAALGTMRLVAKGALSERARDLVKFDKYCEKSSSFLTQGSSSFVRLAAASGRRASFSGCTLTLDPRSGGR